MTFRSTGDAVDVLLSQHEEIKQTLTEVRVCSGADKAVAFDKLRTLLYAHEAGEQEVVHPATRDFAGEGDIAGHRVAEEQHADEMIARLGELGTGHPDFDAEYETFRDAVLQHAAREETEEFPCLRRALTPKVLLAMGDRLRAAEARA
jgi:hypothetical protein